MPVNITDVDAFTDPIVIPADSDPADRTYIVTLAQGLANRTRHVKNYLEPAGVVLPAPQTVVHRCTALGVTPKFTGGACEWTSVDGGQWRSEVNSTTLELDLTQRLPRAASITRVRARVLPGAARSGTARMRLGLVGLDLSFVGAESEEAYDNAAASAQWLDIDLTGAPLPVANAAMWFLQVRAGNTGGSAKDFVYGFEITFTTSTIRND